MKVLVLGGGMSNEREVSLRSSDNIQQALVEAGFDVVFYDPKDGLEELREVLDNKVDVVLPILHGAGGEDGFIQEFLEEHNAKYLGSQPEACRKSFNKWTFRQICQQNDIPVPNGELVTVESFSASHFRDHPFVLKPTMG